MNMENRRAEKNRYTVVDFHTHLLPRLDDGSSSRKETNEMLLCEKAQGISAVVATPHFYPEEEYLQSFLDRRKLACERLLTMYDAKLHPTVYLGAEVAFFAGIGHSKFINQLSIVGTNVIMIEMPFARWSTSDIDEIVFLRECMGMIPIIAHIERYAGFQKRGIVEKMMKNGILFQSNAEYLLDPKNSKKATKQFLCGEIAVLGSDCHNMESRVPNLGQAISVLDQNGGQFALQQLEVIQEFLLKDAISIEALDI